MSMNTLRLRLKLARPLCVLRHGLVIGALLSWGIVVASFAKEGAPDRKAEDLLPFKPYAEAEIQAALQRPLYLEDCIRIALSKSLALRQAAGDLRRAQALRSGSFGIYFPVLNVTGRKQASTSIRSANDELKLKDGGVDYNVEILGNAQMLLPTSSIVTYSTDFFREYDATVPSEPAKKDGRNSTLNLLQPLLRGATPKIANSKVISAGHNKSLQEFNYLGQQLQTIYLIKRAYYVALLQRELIRVNRSGAASDSALVLASEALVLAKLASRRDVLSAQIRAADSRAVLIRSQTDFQGALDLLKDEMGLPIETPITLGADTLKFAPVNLNEAELIQIALNNNPTLNVLKRVVKIAKLNSSLAHNNALPRLDVYGGYFWIHERSAILNADLARKSGWNAGFSFSYPLLHREAAGEAESAEIAARQQEDRLADLERQVTLNIRDIVRSASNSAEEVAAIRHSIAVAEQKLDFARTMFNLGRASNFDVTDAQEFLQNAQNQYLRKLVNYYSQLAQLETLTCKFIAR